MFFTIGNEHRHPTYIRRLLSVHEDENEEGEEEEKNMMFVQQSFDEPKRSKISRNSHLSASKSNITVNASYHRTPSPTSNRCSAYFLQRLDLNDYTVSTLKQIVDTNIPTETRLKGLYDRE